MNRIPAAVIGLGQIGFGYDSDRDRDDNAVLQTHASALHAHPGFELVAAVDLDAGKREGFERKYGKPAYPSLEACASRHEPELFMVGVPTAFHHPVCDSILRGAPRAILCEKPFTGEVALAEDLIAKSQRRNCLLAVNYNRRFIPAMEILRREIAVGKFGEIYKATLFYCKGIRHNGCHFIDLLGYLLGDCSGIRIIRKGRAAAHGDWEPDVALRFGETDLYALAGRDESYYMGEFELIGTKGKVVFVDGEPIRTYVSAVNPLFPSENNLQPPSVLENPDSRALYHVLDNIALALNQGSPLKSTGETALRALKTLDRIQAGILAHTEAI